MTAPCTITVGTDGSAGGRRALAWAIQFAAATGASVQVVTAWAWDGIAFTTGLLGAREDERDNITKRQKHEIDVLLSEVVRPAPTVSARVVEGNPAPTLIAAARTSDLLVLGSRGHGHLATALFGSVSETCVRHGSTPVVVVPARARAGRAEESRART
jgi:nucleotide-binding universal stress UspA family protein